MITSCVYRLPKRLVWYCSDAIRMLPKCCVSSSNRHLYSTTEKMPTIASARKDSFYQRFSKFFKTWKVYPRDFVIKNLKPDQVPPTYKMCYRSELETMVNFSVLGGAVAGVLSSSALLYCIAFKESAAQLMNYEAVGFSAAIVISVVAVNLLSLKVPLRIYYSPQLDNFIAYIPRLVPYATRKMMIQPGTLTPPTKTSEYIPWVNIEYVHIETGQKLLINQNKFVLPMYYNKLIGC